MIDLNAMPLERFPVSGLRHVRDLIDFDGPLLSLFKHPNGESYLYYWCDCDDRANRWMVFRVSEITVLRLTSRLISLSDVIPSGSRDDYIYFLDIADDQSIQAYLALPSNIPESYKPARGVLLEPQFDVEDPAFLCLLDPGRLVGRCLWRFPKNL